MGFYDLDGMKPEEITDLYKRKVAVGQKMTVAQIEVKKGAVTQTHSHTNEEVVVVMSGVWLFHLPTGDVILRKNQMLLIPPGTEHSSEALEDTVAVDICTPARPDWIAGSDRSLHYDPEQYLWAV